MTLLSPTPPSKRTLSSNVPPSVRGRVVELGQAYWKSKCNGDRLPARADIDPLDIPSLLPQIILLDIDRDPWDFRYRLIGTNVVEHLAMDRTGSWMSEISHMAPPSTIFTSCVEVASSGKPLLYSDTPYVGPHQAHMHADDVILPLASDGATPDMLLVFVEYFSKN